MGTILFLANGTPPAMPKTSCIRGSFQLTPSAFLTAAAAVWLLCGSCSPPPAWTLCSGSSQMPGATGHNLCLQQQYPQRGWAPLWSTYGWWLATLWSSSEGVSGGCGRVVYSSITEQASLSGGGGRVVYSSIIEQASLSMLGDGS